MMCPSMALQIRNRCFSERLVKTWGFETLSVETMLDTIAEMKLIFIFNPLFCRCTSEKLWRRLSNGKQPQVS